jgi:ADP-ribosyl-[dinitrogen reductase] hydrolase
MPPPRRPVPPKPLKKGKGPVGPTPEQVVLRKRGVLLGLCVGDALGVTTDDRKIPANQFPELNDSPHNEMRGGGPLKLRPGQVSDEGQLATALGRVLLDHHRYDLVEASKAYARWLPSAVEPLPLEKAAFELIAQGRDPELSGRRVWIESAQRWTSASVLARTAVLGAFFWKDQKERMASTLADVAVSHFELKCQVGAVILNAAIAACIASPKEKAEPAAVLKQIEADLSLAASDLARKHPDFVLQVQDAGEYLRADLKMAQERDPMLYGPELHLWAHAGQVRTALRLAFWEFFHAPSFEAGILDVVNRGGDADMNGAIAGALLGALHGANAIPEKFSQPVLEVPGGLWASGPLWKTYHPSFLMPLAEREPGTPVPPKPE